MQHTFNHEEVPNGIGGTVKYCYIDGVCMATLYQSNKVSIHHGVNPVPIDDMIELLNYISTIKYPPGLRPY